MIRSAIAVLAVALTTGVLGTALIAPAPAHADPGVPGCTVGDAWADHTRGLVVWEVTCTETRDVVVDASAWHGTPEDHELVRAQDVLHRVEAGTTWSSTLVFDPETTPSTDMITAQILSWVRQGDSTEPPAILRTLQG